MAAPTRNASKPDDPRQRKTREAIKTTQLVKRLQCFALEEKDDAGNDVEIDAGRMKAIEILLRKALPDLASVAITNDEDGNPFKTKETGDGAAKLAALIDAISSRTSSESAG